MTLQDRPTEEILRDLMRCEAAEVYATDSLFAEVVQGHQRRRRGRRNLVLVSSASAAVALVGAGCYEVALGRAGGEPACAATPAVPGRAAARPVAADATGLAPGTPTSALVCSYAAPGAQVRRAVVRGRPLAALLRALRGPIAPPACAATGPTLTLTLRYATEPDLRVTVGLGDCPVATNGTTTGVSRPLRDALAQQFGAQAG